MNTIKKLIYLVLILIVILLLVNMDDIYLKTQEDKWNETDFYIEQINSKREEEGKDGVEEAGLHILTRYSGNHIFFTQAYTEDRLEMVFLTKAKKKGFFDWEYQTVPFVPEENIIDEAFDGWGLEVQYFKSK